ARQCLPLVGLRAVLQIGLIIAILTVQEDLADPPVILQLIGMCLSIGYFPLELYMSYAYIANNTNEDDDDDRISGSVCTLFVCIPFHVLTGALLVASFVIASTRSEITPAALDYISFSLGILWLLPGTILLFSSLFGILVFACGRMSLPKAGRGTQNQLPDPEMLGADRT
ncbi:Snapc3, partial [Symbiodinium pilosum]